jgi:hypothetical protein
MTIDNEDIFIENEEDLEEKNIPVIEEEYSSEIEEPDFETEVLKHLSKMSNDIGAVKIILLIPLVVGVVWLVVIFIGLVFGG